MSTFLNTYGLFLAKSLTIVLAILATLAGILVLLARGKIKSKEKLTILDLSKNYQTTKDLMHRSILDKKALQRYLKTAKNKAAQQNRVKTKAKRLFVLDFTGDLQASAVENLREAITALLTIALPAQDEVLLKLESAGGTVHGYGLAASQLKRIRDRGIHLTVAIDKIAASGGYMMACVAHKILAAPFAIIGSIGVIAQLPNFHRLLKKHHIDYEQIVAGEFKRTLTLFGENTPAGRAKAQQEVNEIHELFQTFIRQNRPAVDIHQLATGETWYGTRARENKLVDEVITSDDYLLEASEKSSIYKVSYSSKKSIGKKLLASLNGQLKKLYSYYQI